VTPGHDFSRFVHKRKAPDTNPPETRVVNHDSKDQYVVNINERQILVKEIYVLKKQLAKKCEEIHELKNQVLLRGLSCDFCRHDNETKSKI